MKTIFDIFWISPNENIGSVNREGLGTCLRKLILQPSQIFEFYSFHALQGTVRSIVYEHLLSRDDGAKIMEKVISKSSLRDRIFCPIYM